MLSSDTGASWFDSSVMAHFNTRRQQISGRQFSLFFMVISKPYSSIGTRCSPYVKNTKIQLSKIVTLYIHKANLSISENTLFGIFQNHLAQWNQLVVDIGSSRLAEQRV